MFGTTLKGVGVFLPEGYSMGADTLDVTQLSFASREMLFHSLRSASTLHTKVLLDGENKPTHVAVKIKNKRYGLQFALLMAAFLYSTLVLWSLDLALYWYKPVVVLPRLVAFETLAEREQWVVDALRHFFREYRRILVGLTLIFLFGILLVKRAFKFLLNCRYCTPTWGYRIYPVVVVASEKEVEETEKTMSQGSL